MSEKNNQSIHKSGVGFTESFGKCCPCLCVDVKGYVCSVNNNRMFDASVTCRQLWRGCKLYKEKEIKGQ